MKPPLQHPEVPPTSAPSARPQWPQPETDVSQRPIAKGKFLHVGESKLWVRGVTYGTFKENGDGQPYPQPSVVEQDFAAMASCGMNAVRTYTVPPRWILDLAYRHGLRIMVGLPWEQHVTFLDERRRARLIEERMRKGVRTCADHPAVLGYAVGNEIPASIVRWHGRRRIEKWLHRLYAAAKAEDPRGLVTYVNYPTTEYLQLPFLDFVCFNVYLESRDNLAAYLARVHNLAGERPLVLAEVGLDSQRHGHVTQARVLDWQVRTTFGSGCAGAFLFAWTDEWHRGGYDVDNWDFGLTTRDRRPKPALAVVEKAFRDVPHNPNESWPLISVVVCCYNEERVIRDCLEGLRKVEYPAFEVIVVDDGSTDGTASIAKEYGVDVISTPNRGLSSARNTGIRAAQGEIVAFIDGDAYPDPHWLTYMAAAFATTQHAGIAGPNVAPPGDGWFADCVDNAPGNPTHVLLSDDVAEHIPGCNMAFRKRHLEAIGGFDTRFRTAGDDVDVSWRLQEKGWTLGFHPSAMVWHHRRNSLRAYWKQQRGYGYAESLLEKKWPDKYNAAGHYVWSGRVYAAGLTHPLPWRRTRIYQGTWGSALFQSLYTPSPNRLQALTLMPEWYLIVLGLAVAVGLGSLYEPLLMLSPILALTVIVPLVQACLNAAKASFGTVVHSPAARWRSRAVIASLHVIHALARLQGRLSGGLTPWRRCGHARFAFPLPRRKRVWNEHWQAPQTWLETVEAELRAHGLVVRRGGDFDRWDLEARSGFFGTLRLRMSVEEHGSGKQLVHFLLWPRASIGVSLLTVALGTLSAVAATDLSWAVSVLFGSSSVLIALRILVDCSASMAGALSAVDRSTANGLWLEPPLHRSLATILWFFRDDRREATTTEHAGEKPGLYPEPVERQDEGQTETPLNCGEPRT